MSDDDRIPECNDCGDDRGLCGRPHLQDSRRFTIKHDETFDVCTCIPCHARRYVLEKLDFEDHENLETKRVHLRTHHGYVFAVKLYNAVTYSHFGCSTWTSLCKAYGFQEGMHVTFDLGDPEDDIDEDNIDIWVDVDTLPLLPLSYFHSSKNVWKVVDKTYYTDGSELTYEEKDHLVSFIIDVETFNSNYEIPPHYGQYLPLVHVLNYGNIHGNGMKIPKDCVPQLMHTKDDIDIRILRPSLPAVLRCAYTISKRDEDLTIKGWKKVMNSRRELLGGNMVRSPRIGDRIISILHNEESGAIMFYAILP